MTNRNIKKTFPPVGRLQLFKLEKVESATCSECGKEKTSKNWAVLDGSWDHRMCNGCYRMCNGCYRMCNGCYGQVLATPNHPFKETN